HRDEHDQLGWHRGLHRDGIRGVGRRFHATESQSRREQARAGDGVCASRGHENRAVTLRGKRNMTALRAEFHRAEWRRPCTPHIVAQPLPELAQVAHPQDHSVPLTENVVLRTAVYYVVLFGIAALL